MRQFCVVLICLWLTSIAGVSEPAAATAAPEQVWPDKPRVERLRGKVSPSREVTLAVPVDGVLEAIHVAEAEPVTQGQVLATMDDALQRLTVEAARQRAEQIAPRLRAERGLEQARTELQRVRRLHSREAASEWEVRQVQFEHDQAEVALREISEAEQLAAVEYELEQQRLERYRVEAPFDGVVWRIEAEAGAALTRSDALLVLLALDPLEAELHLPIALYQLLEVGQTYRLHPEAGGPVTDELRGRLARIDPVMDIASRTFRCVFEIDNPDRQWPAGFNVELAWPPVPSALPVRAVTPLVPGDVSPPAGDQGPHVAE